MSKLDLKYITHLVVDAQAGSSEAFAELYAATYQDQYRFAYLYLKDEYLAQDALQQTYIESLGALGTLNDPALFLPQLRQIGYKTCLSISMKQKNDFDNFEETMVTIDGNSYSIRRILNLPFTESQILLMRYCDRMTNHKIAKMMKISQRSVHHYLSLGRKRLHLLLKL